MKKFVVSPSGGIFLTPKFPPEDGTTNTKIMATTELIKLNMKLAAGAGKKLDKLLAEAPGIESVIQTFPDEIDEELSRLYVLEIRASESEATIKMLNANPEIEYVEPSAPRRLIRESNRK